MSVRQILILLGAVLCLAAEPNPAERLADPAAEARARSLFQETRCLVCQGQSIDDSDAELAHDLRQIIRHQIAAGESSAHVRGFLTARYGDYVLLQPPFSAKNAILWTGPFLVGALGLGLLRARLRRSAPTAPLTPEEDARLARLDQTDPA